ncbi:MAG: di-heme enzyme [Polyangiales bacterium]
MRLARIASVALAALLGCSSADEPAGYDWRLPPGFPRPLVPEDNPMTAAGFELGRRLFYDARLSGNQTQSCASCHRQELAFTDGLPTSRGSTGEATPRNAMSLANVAYASTYTWANPTLITLEAQGLTPLFGEHPTELGLRGREGELVARLRAVPRYRELFARAFPGEADPVTVRNVLKGLASFQRALISGDSPYDRYQRGDRAALSESARRGERLFGSERFECFHCHAGFNFQDAVRHVGRPFNEDLFHNTGLYNIGGRGDYPANNTGLREFTRRAEDMGRFRAPTLRNVAVTAPYMHDGSVATLPEVIDHYAAGGRTIASGPYAGVGRANPYKSVFVIGFTPTPQERADLLAFLESLTDSTFLRDPRFADPWPTQP